MTGIWRKDGDTWSLVGPSRIPDEDALQQQIVDAIVNDPQALPLSGQPRLAIVGQQVWLGNGEADVLAIERDGRPVVIEAKLARNPEARRKVVAQALEYAADLHRMPARGLEAILKAHLQQRGHETIAEAVGALEQDVLVDETAFYASLSEHLARGSFRIVFLLDAAPPVLVKLAGFLEAITDRVVVDLVTISTYDVGAEQIFLPQRIDPERVTEREPPRSAQRQPQQWSDPYEGSEVFRASIDGVSDEEEAALLRKLADWADALDTEHLCSLKSFTNFTNGATTFYARLPDEPDNVSLAFAWNYSGSARLYVNGTVIARRAPVSKARIEEAANQEFPGNQMRPKVITDELLDALTQAYREAAGGE